MAEAQLFLCRVCEESFKSASRLRLHEAACKSKKLKRCNELAQENKTKRAIRSVKEFHLFDGKARMGTTAAVDNLKVVVLMCHGVVVLNGTVPEEHYHNFFLLSCGIRILASPVLWHSHNTVAKQLLRHFVEHYSALYGRSMVVYNVHSVIHLSDVLNHGPLDHFSSFPFENFLQKLKKCVRKPNFPLQQAVLRLNEMSAFASALSPTPIFQFKQVHFSGPRPDTDLYSHVTLYKQALFADFFLSLDQRNSRCQIGDNVAIAQNFFSCTERSLVIYSKFDALDNFFSYPVNSSSLGIFKVVDLSPVLYIAEVCNVTCKYVQLPHNREVVVIPLLHT
ncbi:hypothetical protein CAPTEDRAFT_216210 [Capitella teleta]|uniref:Uncharacterized protein n=1 Tax=Capitella teleta TaxID=283909 RepID=R7V3Q3_CAPTE|nr:hypothetical protein CAPTEDRAFT_216210 [Capitella teleta]|eukprot:ELU13483.1 hypothetical protein CAPTEDRAFT_216210 [Capitella teleta]